MRKRIPQEVRCSWLKKLGESGVYECPHCKCWTANLPLYVFSICPKKDRRKGKRDRRGDIK